jgi:ABC-2 type transport system permease protein
MRAFFSTYWLYIITFFKSRAEYRAGFFFGLFSNFYCYFITYASYWVLISGLGSIGGWDFSDLSILYGLSLLTYAISGTLLWYTVYHLGGIITSGGLDMYLTRPLGVLRQMIFQRFGDTFIGQILVTIIFLTVAILSKASIMTPIKFGFLLLSIIGGILIQAGGMILIGSISFWTKRSGEIGDIFYYDIRNITQYPLGIFPRWIQLALTYVFPWAFINYYPALILLDKAQGASDFILGLLSPVVGLLFLALSLFVFHQGLKKYSGAGS